jgi:hypothetical protein
MVNVPERAENSHGNAAIRARAEPPIRNKSETFQPLVRFSTQKLGR